MTLGSSGVAYVVAVWCIFLLAGALRLRSAPRVALTASFGLATLAPTYARSVNGHILLLAVAAALLLGLVALADERRAGSFAGGHPLALGTLAGLGYSIDLGAGALLLVCALAVTAHRCRHIRAMTLFVLGALPWLALHHALNYAIGGTFGPVATVPEYFQWPGSTFTLQNLTGTWNHPTLGRFLWYAAALLFGGRGFIGHDPPVFLALPAAVALLRRRPFERPEILFAVTWAVGTWLLYAAVSTNYSGVAASIRWFVPLLAPAYLVLAIFLREHPRYLRDFLTLGAWGVLVAGLTWVKGPWMKGPVPGFWFLLAGALLSWALCRVAPDGREAPRAPACPS
jgi:hypothetical protein